MSKHTVFDDILEKRVGFGAYQRRSFLFLGLTTLADESEIISISLVLPVLKQEWQISEAKSAALGSAFFFGIFIGAIVAGYIADKYGRRTTLLFATLFQFILGAASAFVNSVDTLIILRGLVGIVIGFTLPTTTTYATEISPANKRANAQVILQVFFVLGLLYAMIFAEFLLTDLTSGHWRIFLFIGAIPSLIVFIGTAKYLQESPRYFIAVGKIQNGISILNSMGFINNGNFALITEEEEHDLKRWQTKTFSQTEVAKVSILFKEGQRALTAQLLSNWIGLSFNFFGAVFILPFVFARIDDTKQGMNLLFLTLLGEVPSLLIAHVTLDHPKFGRRGSTLLGHIFGFLFFMGVGLSGGGVVMILCLIFSRMCTKYSFITLNPLTSELYRTTYRSAATGFLMGIGRIGGVIMPEVTFYLFDNVSTFAPFYAFASVCAVMAVMTFSIAEEPLRTPLDLKTANSIEIPLIEKTAHDSHQ